MFALNPVIEEQNVYDAFSRSRDLQIAFAMAVASGNMRANQALRFSRQVTLEMAAIGLNRTAVAFAHDNDTFGWYFHPRVQSPPPERSNIAAFGRLLWSSGPTDRYDQKHQKIDPGIRECEAVIVMPGFIPGVRFDVITNWEKRNKPGAVKRDYAEMLVQGAQIQRTLQYASQVTDQQCFRPDDYSILVSRVEQIEKMLPLQSVNVSLPFEHELSGSELFDGGRSQLKPGLDGYYGITRVAGTDKSEMFLTGEHFHPTLTRVIIGGREADEVIILSRSLLKVRFKEVAKALTDDPVEIRVATPAGVSPPLTIPMSAEPAKSGFAWEPATLVGVYQSSEGTQCKAKIDFGDLKVKYKGGVTISGAGCITLTPKYTAADGSVINISPPNAEPVRVKGLMLQDGTVYFNPHILRALLVERIQQDLKTTLLNNAPFTVSFETLVTIECAAAKTDKPLVIKFTFLPCDPCNPCDADRCPCLGESPLPGANMIDEVPTGEMEFDPQADPMFDAEEIESYEELPSGTPTEPLFTPEARRPAPRKSTRVAKPVWKIDAGRPPLPSVTRIAPAKY